MKPTALAIIALVAACININAHAEILYTSYPSNSDPMLGMADNSLRGVLFSPGSQSYQVTAITAPLVILPGFTPPSANTSVFFELWSSAASPLYNDHRQRPTELLGKWETVPIATNDYLPTRTYQFEDYVVSTDNGPLLSAYNSYWFVIEAGWNGENPGATVQWAGSTTVIGTGHSLEMIGTPVPPLVTDTYVNMGSYGFPAFKIEGQSIASVPEPASYMLLLAGLVLLGVAVKRRPKEHLKRLYDL
jgi:hypothetical protein